MDLHLEHALADLAASTEALLAVDPHDAGAVAVAIGKRADAITKIAFLAEEGADPGQELMGGLRAALARGEEAGGKLTTLRRETLEEWIRLSRLGANIGQLPGHSISYTG